jgi:hypothetical protein
MFIFKSQTPGVWSLNVVMRALCNAHCQITNSCVLLLLCVHYTYAIHEIDQHCSVCILQCQSMTFIAQACWLKHGCGHCWTPSPWRFNRHYLKLSVHYPSFMHVELSKPKFNLCGHQLKVDVHFSSLVHVELLILIRWLFTIFYWTNEW